jgi:hypothetical protein
VTGPDGLARSYPAALPLDKQRGRALQPDLATECVHSRAFADNDQRSALLPTWLEHYNLERPHTGIGGRSPISRVSNAAAKHACAYVACRPSDTDRAPTVLDRGGF